MRRDWLQSGEKDSWLEKSCWEKRTDTEITRNLNDLGIRRTPSLLLSDTFTRFVTKLQSEDTVLIEASSAGNIRIFV
jgi:hypothetical protein